MKLKLKMLGLALIVGTIALAGTSLLLAQEPDAAAVAAPVEEPILVPVAAESAPVAAKEAETEAAEDAVAESETSAVGAALKANDSPTAPPTGMGAIAFVITSLITLLGAITKLPMMPEGTRTIINNVIAGLGTIMLLFGDLSAIGRVAIGSGVGFSLIGGIIGRIKAGFGKRLPA